MQAGLGIYETPFTRDTFQALVGTSDEGLRDSSSSGGEMRAWATFLRHLKPGKALKSASIFKVTSAGRRVFKT